MTDAMPLNGPMADRANARSLTDVVLGLEDAAIGSTIPTGFEPLDAVLDGGLRTRDLTLIAGLPGVGKTVLTLQWARNMADDGYRASYVCYEHDEYALAGRLLAVEVGELVQQETDLRSGPTLAVINGVSQAELRLEEEMDQDPVLRSAIQRMSNYSDELELVAASGVETGVDALREVASRLGPGGVMFVDYMQKIPVGSQTGWTDSERSIRQAEELKELAMSYDIAVVAVVASEREGLNARRLRPYHLRGASGLAYEADIILVLNEKYLAVSKLHSAYDPVQAEGFKRDVVLTVEKNRRGLADRELQFTKDFVHFRFNTVGSFVEERLIDDLMFPE